jgi:hypothetical protein
VQIAARHADRRMTMRYDRARIQLDRHVHYVLAARVAGAIKGQVEVTWPPGNDIVRGSW